MFNINFNEKNNLIFFSEEITQSSYYVTYLIFFTYIFFTLVVNVYNINNLSQKYLPVRIKTSGSSIFNGENIKKLISLFLFLNLITVSSLKGYSSSIWFSHLIFDNFQIKMMYIIIISFYLIVMLTISNMSVITLDKQDYVLSTLNMYFWVSLMFLTSNLFTFIFILEVLSISVMLLNSTSTNYATLSTNKSNFSNNMYSFINLPYYKLNSLIFYFWVSFIASVNLFIFLYFYIYYFLTLDLVFTDFIVFYFKINWTSLNFIPWMFTWFLLLTCIFIKCGLAPFYVWKPQFFKGISLIYMLFYTCFYYFFTLIFLITFIFGNFIEIFNCFILLTISLLLIGLLFLLGSLYSISHIKSFFAYSSILNTLFIFFITISSSYENLLII